MNHTEKLQAALNHTDKLYDILDSLNEGGRNEDVMSLQRYLTSQLEVSKTLDLVTRINNTALIFEDLFSGFVEDDEDVEELKIDVQNIVFKSQAIMDRLNEVLGTKS